MIFNSDYDKILWLILKNDKVNRERILEFIEDIPCEFLIEIQNVIKEYKLKGSIDKINRYFCGEYEDEYENVYNFFIDTDIDSLFIGRNIFKYGKMFNDFGLLLTNGIDKNNMNELCEYVIGKLSFDYDVINNGVELFQGNCRIIDYKIIDVMFGNIMVMSNHDKIMFKDKLKFISIDDIPKDYGVNDLNKLIRKREKR